MNVTPIAKHLVFVGGGHAHVLALRMLAMEPVPGLQITLISPSVQTPYSGMLPGLVAGHYDVEDIHIDLVPLCRFAGADFIQSSVTAIDPVEQSVSCEGRPDVHYDVLSIDIGITPDLGISTTEEEVVAVKPIDQFLDRFEPFLERFRQGGLQTVGFVGAGAGGVELCLAVQHRLQEEGRELGFSQQVEFKLFFDGEHLLKEYSEAVQQRFIEVMTQRKVRLYRNFRVASVDNKELVAESGERVKVDEIFWVTSAAPASWLRNTGLALDKQGYILVRDTLQTEDYDNIFAVGDIANVVNHPRPKAGVYAVRQGKPLAINLRRLLSDQPVKPYQPQSEFLSLISTGDKSAVAYRNGVSFSGRWVWLWKDWIDRRFMKRFSSLPEMKAETRTGLLKDFDEQMQCGGCGSKVSAEILNEVLDELALNTPSLLHRDDAAIYTVPDGLKMLHTIDSFRSFISDPYLFARVAVVHALSDIYAMGGRPVTALATITVPFARPVIIKSLLQQLLAGAMEQLEIDQVELVGGHTSEGAELSIGFSVNGVVHEDDIVNKTGVMAGDAILLTKPLGTGVIFAADMQHLARGKDVNSAIESMLQSNASALTILRQHHLTACTDVTGFGLAGHLKEMLAGSGCVAEVNIDQLPLLPGALELMHDLAIRSTLHEGNKRSIHGVDHSRHAHYEMLFDPQTSGGLLATVSKAQLASCVAELRDAGYTGVKQIGTIAAGENELIKLAGNEERQGPAQDTAIEMV